MTRAPALHASYAHLRRLRSRAARVSGALLCLTWIIAGCQSAPPPVAESPTIESSSDTQVRDDPKPEPPPYIPPPEPGPERWVLPDIGQAAPYFPFLPDDDRD